MAKKTPRGARAAKPAAPAREPKAKSKKVTTTEIEVVEESPGEGIDAGIAIITTVILVAAILFVDAFRGASGEGLFF